ncbi:unnamed protein product, partial [Musa textilis]
IFCSAKLCGGESGKRQGSFFLMYLSLRKQWTRNVSCKTKKDSPDVKPFKNRIGTKTTTTGGTVCNEMSNWGIRALPLREPVESAGEGWWRRVLR